MNVLINAFAISPYHGSENGVGWHWAEGIAKYCNVFLICGDEYRDEVETGVNASPYRENLHVTFNEIPPHVIDKVKNQGDWRFYYYYRKWQKKSYEIAKVICKENEIDIIHQLNLVSFREPGYLWKLGKPMVWGPIGGLGETPKRFMDGASMKMKTLFLLKDFISILQLRFSSHIDKAFSHTDVLISAVPNAQLKILKYKKRTSFLIPETGCDDLDTEVIDKRNRREFHILWVGRFIYTKRLDIALRTIARIKDIENLHFHIMGSGNDKQVKYYKGLATKYGINHICEWHGNVDNRKVHEMMRLSDIFFFTSIREATSTVVPEAINNCLPIVCFNACGFGRLVSPLIGRTVEMTKPDQSVLEFAEQIKNLYSNKELLYSMSLNCKEALKQLLWEEKAKSLFKIYKQLTETK